MVPIEESFSSNPKTDTLQRMTSMGSATFSQSSMPSSMLVNPPEEIAKCEKEYFSPLEKALKTAAITAGASRLISALLENIEDESIKYLREEKYLPAIINIILFITAQFASKIINQTSLCQKRNKQVLPKLTETNLNQITPNTEECDAESIKKP